MQKLVYKNLILVAGTILLMAMQTKTFKITQTDDLKEVMKSGEKIYKANCLSCHQINGSGVPSLAPPLIKTSYVLGEKSHLIHIVLDGFNDDVEIEGEYYSNPMPAFNQLTDKEIADVDLCTK